MFSCKNNYSPSDLKVALSLTLKCIEDSLLFKNVPLKLKNFILIDFLFIHYDQEIQCYICRSFGHVCCVDSVDIHSSNVSCYRCGQLGHTGLVCLLFVVLTNCLLFMFHQFLIFIEQTCSRQRGNRNEGEKTPSSCIRSGEEGHSSKECKNPSKVIKL